MDIDTNLIITIVSALAAAGSFVAFAWPYLERSDRQSRYRQVIEKRRKDLFEATKEGKKAPSQKENPTARQSLSTFYRLQKLGGEMGEKIRSKLLQAGIRDPGAPFKFMIAQMVLPLLFVGLAMFFIAMADRDLAPGITLLIFFALAGFGFKLPDILVKNAAMKRQQDISLAFPDALDMMLICVQGGIGLEQTVDRVASEISSHSPILAEELGILSAEMAMLNDRRQALQDFSRRVGSAGAKSFATALIQAEQYGTSVTQAMRVISEEIREVRMATAEQKAAALPPKLTVPMILFFLPALFVIILGPAGIQASAGG